MQLETRAALWAAVDTHRSVGVELVEAGRPVADVALDLGVSVRSIYQWRRQSRIDDGVTSSQRAELAAANQSSYSVARPPANDHATADVGSPQQRCRSRREVTMSIVTSDY